MSEYSDQQLLGALADTRVPNVVLYPWQVSGGGLYLLSVMIMLSGANDVSVPWSGDIRHVTAPGHHHRGLHPRPHHQQGPPGEAADNQIHQVRK